MRDQERERANTLSRPCFRSPSSALLPSFYFLSVRKKKKKGKKKGAERWFNASRPPSAPLVAFLLNQKRKNRAWRGEGRGVCVRRLPAMRREEKTAAAYVSSQTDKTCPRAQTERGYTKRRRGATEMRYPLPLPCPVTQELTPRRRERGNEARAEGRAREGGTGRSSRVGDRHDMEQAGLRTRATDRPTSSRGWGLPCA